MSSSMTDFDSLWDYNKPAETEQRFRELLPAAENAADTSYHVQLLTQIARAQGLQRNFDQAHQTLDTAEKLLTPQFTRAHIRLLLERGRVFNSSGDKDKARPLFLQAWQEAIDSGEDFYAIDAAHMLGIIEPPEQQMEWNLRAVAIAEKTADERGRNWLGSLYNNIGWTYHDAGQFEDALGIFHKALNYRQKQGKADTIRIARWCIGRTLRSLHRIDEALAIQRQLLAEHETSNGEAAYVYEELGECLHLQDNKEAAPFFARAYALLSKDEWLSQNEPQRLERLKQLGMV
jgi:tetratricopeptide (TPR) repeat protein